MRRILKHDISGALMGGVTLSLPIDATVLRIDVQRDVPCMWVEGSDDVEQVPSRLVAYPTGGYPDGGWVGTFFMDDATFVWHVYEAKP